MFDWTKGEPKNNGANQTVLPRTYKMISEDFGKETAEQYLALCKVKHDEITRVTLFSETPEAREFRENLNWE